MKFIESIPEDQVLVPLRGNQDDCIKKNGNGFDAYDIVEAVEVFSKFIKKIYLFIFKKIN